MANDVSINIDFDEDTMIIVPDSGKAYWYSLDEVTNDVVDRLIAGDADYTVYSQGKRYTEDELSREEILDAIREEELEIETPFRRR